MPDGDTWYFEQDNQQRGPIPFHELKRMAHSGELQPSQLVWTPGMADWMPASSIAELFATAGQPAVEPMSAPHPQPIMVETLDPLPSDPQTIGYFAPPPGFAVYAGFWLRFVAYIIDTIALTVATQFVLILFASVVSRGGPNLIDIIAMMRTLSGIAVGWIYYATMESSSLQATLGKMALGIKVTDMEGNPVSFGRATGRFFGKYLSWLTITIGFILAGVSERKQALHDMLASTLVVKK